MNTIEDLADAYESTTYWVGAEPRPIGIRIGERAPALERLLARRGLTHWAFVTACNPGSQLRAPWFNTGRHLALLQVLRRGGYGWLIALAQGDAGDWPSETGVLVPGMDAASARNLGRRFGQNAVVVGRRGQPARLLWCVRAPD